MSPHLKAEVVADIKVAEKDSLIQTRRDFIKYLGTGILGGFLVLWYALTQKHILLSGGQGFQKIDLSQKADGFHFFDSFIAVKKGASIKVLSNTCTHAGCKVNKIHGDTIVCACHGSAYNSMGQVLKGPATKNLRSLAFSTDPVTGVITVKL